MSKLEEAMREHMAYLVFSENRPFSYRDFMRFELDGKEYKMTHGTYRNKISKLKKEGHIELDYKSGIAFHTLKGHKFGKSLMMMTPDHTVVSSSYNHQDPVCR